MDDIDDIEFNEHVIQQCYLAESQALQKQRNQTLNNNVNKKAKTSSNNSTGSFQDDFAFFENFSSWSSARENQESGFAVGMNQASGSSVKAIPSKPKNSNIELQELEVLRKQVADLQEQIMIKQGEVSNLPINDFCQYESN